MRRSALATRLGAAVVLRLAFGVIIDKEEMLVVASAGAIGQPTS